MNNLYGDAMSEYLPYADFKWVKDISAGYILEVDLEYPQNCMIIHNDYPLALEKSNLSKEWLSDHSLEIANAHNITAGTVKKD